MPTKEHTVIAFQIVVGLDMRPENRATLLRLHHQRRLQFRERSLASCLHFREVEVEREDPPAADLRMQVMHMFDVSADFEFHLCCVNQSEVRTTLKYGFFGLNF